MAPLLAAVLLRQCPDAISFESRSVHQHKLLGYCATGNCRTKGIQLMLYIPRATKSPLARNETSLYKRETCERAPFFFFLFLNVFLWNAEWKASSHGPKELSSIKQKFPTVHYWFRDEFANFVCDAKANKSFLYLRIVCRTKSRQGQWTNQQCCSFLEKEERENESTKEKRYT